MDIYTAIGNTFLIVLFTLYVTWVVVENKRDWFNRPRRATRFISLFLTCIGIIAVVLHVVGFNILHIDLLWWSIPFLAFVSSFALGVLRPKAGIDTAYRFMVLAAPASLLGSAMGFIPLLLGQIGGCLLGFRLGEGIHHLVCWIQRDKNPNKEMQY